MQSKGRVPPGVITTDPLEQAVAAFRSGQGTAEAVVKSYYDSPRVRRLIAHACFSSRLSPDFEDELKQELAVLLSEKFLDTIQQPEKIYNVLHLSACHIARRRADKATEDSLDALLEPQGEPDNCASAILADERDFAAEVEDSIDHQRAVDEFNRRLEEQTNTDRGNQMEYGHHLYINPNRERVVYPRRPRDEKKAEKKALSPSAECVELNEIRKELGYSVPAFATVLNTTKGTLSSYLYGIVKHVPESVMREARMLRRQAGAEYRALQKKFGDLSMREIVDGWIKRLGITEGPKAIDAQLAEVLGVDRVTVWRWRERNMRPDLRTLKEYEDKVMARGRRQRPSKVVEG